MKEFFTAIIYQPLYNGFIFLTSILPGASAGFAIVSLTLIIRGILLPLSHKAVASQAKLKELNPEVNAIKEQYSKDKQEQARKIMELYKTHRINPFSGCLSVLIQIPLVIGLFYVFFKGLGGEIDTSILYSFVTAPDTINYQFLGFIDLTEKSALLAALAGVTQFYQMKLSLPPLPPRDENKTPSFKDELTRSMGTQMRYVLPFIVFFVGYTISAAVALYWTTSNLFSIAHEYFVKRKAEHIKEESA